MPTHARVGLRRTLQMILIVVAVVLAACLHLGLAGVIAANWKWTGLAAGAVLAVVVLKVAFIGAHLGVRHRRSPGTKDG